jgi:argininosuccinate lyase/amino-acid N-acetyltransferase
MSRPTKEGHRVPAGRLWGGGFGEGPDPALEAFCASFAFDRRLLRADVAANRAWVACLMEAGVLTGEEADRLDGALRAVAEGPHSAAPEDVHTYVEMALAQAVGRDLAGKLRTGRSRNDLVATDLRLWCREEVAVLRARVVAGVRALTDLAERSGALAVPGYTHLRRAQPILLAHLVLAHAHRLVRDDDRLAEALRRGDECPLGSGALAGTTVPVDRQALARRLGFARPSANSLDAVSDRDFAADALYACALLMIHLSQIAEDLILATAEEFGWLALGDAAATGSSLMPQKKNPDVLELVRGKAGRVSGRLAGFLMTLKGLPAAYNRDLQEDKEALFEAVDTARGSLEALAAVLPRLMPVPARGLQGNHAGDLLATDLADYLAARGLPFAQAHHLAGEAVARARRDGVPLARLPLETLRALSPLLDEGVRSWLTVEASLARRDREGGTAPERVAEDLRRLRAWASSHRPTGGSGVSEPPASGHGTPEVRLRPAADPDLPLIEGRIKTWSDRGVLLPLSGRQLRAALHDFRVLATADDPATVLAFGALRRYSQRLAEIRSLVVADHERGHGLGGLLVGHLVEEARREGLRRVFVLTRAPDFFARRGFVAVPRESLPEKVFVDCNLCHRRERCDEQALVRDLP